MEHHSLAAASVGGKAPARPRLSAEEMTCLSSELAVLDQILQPSHMKGVELATEVAKFLARFPFGLRHDASHMQAKVDGWCEDLEAYPLYAVKRALGYWRRNSDKEPSFAEVLADVKLFTGKNVLTRRRLLQQWMTA